MISFFKNKEKEEDGVNNDNSYSNIPRFGDKPINTPINPSIQAPF